jgi:hypothetical protein
MAANINDTWYGANALDLAFKTSVAQETYQWCKDVPAADVCSDKPFSESQAKCEWPGCCKWTEGYIYGGTCSSNEETKTGQATCPQLPCVYPEAADMKADCTKSPAANTLNKDCYNSENGWSKDGVCDPLEAGVLGGCKHTAPPVLSNLETAYRMKPICNGSIALASCSYQFCGTDGCNNKVQLNSAPGLGGTSLQLLSLSLVTFLVTLTQFSSW